MRATLFAIVSVVVGNLLAGCAGPVCDLDRVANSVHVQLSTPLSDYDATLETTDAWLQGVRAVDESTGEEQDGSVLEPVTAEPALVTVLCRDGVTIARGDEPDPELPCAEGFAFAQDDLVPAEAAVRMTTVDDGREFAAPAEGFRQLEYEPVYGALECPVKGYLATLAIETER